MSKGGVLVNSQANVAALSLGFQTYAALGLPVEAHKVAGQVPCSQFGNSTFGCLRLSYN